MIRAVSRVVLAAGYAVAGYLHLAKPDALLGIMPPWVPAPRELILATGAAELLGAAGLAQPWWPRLRRAAAIGLALYAVCVFPANIHHFALDMARADEGWGLAYHVPRMIAQPVLVWLALWSGQVVDWPWGRSGGPA